MAKNRTWTDNELIEAFNNNRSIRQILIQLGLVPIGGNYKTIKAHMLRLGLDQNKLAGKGWKIGNSTPVFPARPLSEILQKGTNCQSSKLRKRLIAAKVFANVCVECGVSGLYNNKPIILHLDHIDGDNTNNLLENLRLLCPNCHSQTDTYCGKNINNPHYSNRQREGA